jgi:type II secretory pathway pseudopilin PulG
MNRRDRGFTLVESIVATGLTVCIAAAVFAAVHPAEAVFGVQAEAADMQQRLRVAVAALRRDLAMAGAGIDAAGGSPLVDYFPPLLPYRQGRTGGDTPGTFRTDATTVLYVPSLTAQTTTSTAMPARAADVQVNILPGCPVTDSSCGFSAATTALIFDETGSLDRFRVAGVDGSRLDLQHTLPDSSKIYAPGSWIVAGVSRSYFLRAAAPGAASQLMRDDGAAGGAAPVVDHVVQLAFEYFGDPRPPTRPSPPEPGRQTTSYPPGENCLFMRDGDSNAVPRLPRLPADNGLVRLSASQLTDGPWCPDSSGANRFDADLLRIRKVALTIRIESAIEAFRGPAGPLFSRQGTSTTAGRFLPDLAVRLEIAPPNLGLDR